MVVLKARFEEGEHDPEPVKTFTCLAVDLGAESGRVMQAAFRDGRVTLREVQRFPNGPVAQDGALAWNLEGLWAAVLEGLRRAAPELPPGATLAVDSWGVDYVRLDAAGRWLAPAFSYRDARCARGQALADARVPWPEQFAAAGIQRMAINSSCQLLAETPARLAETAQVLWIADAFHQRLTGRAVAEATLASTSALTAAGRAAWAWGLIEDFGLPRGIFPPIVPSGTRLGPLRPELGISAGGAAVEVITGCAHDTAAAVLAVPAAGEDWAYLSSGTWSLLGLELPAPGLTAACRELNFTNEAGHGGTIRLLKNIVGLWLVQECRRTWAARGEAPDYATLAAQAEAATPWRSLVNPADPRFLAPGDMPARLAAFCRETGQPEPDTPGAFVRCALESLALQYRRTLREAEAVTGRTVHRLHVVGGGSRNTLLNRLTAAACGVPVHAGPAEATALGNALVQALTAGALPGVAAARELAARSFPPAVFTPEPLPGLAEAVRRFAALGAA